MGNGGNRGEGGEGIGREKEGDEQTIGKPAASLITSNPISVPSIPLYLD